MWYKDLLRIRMSPKTQYDGHIVQKDYFDVFTYCSRISIFDAVSQFNDGAGKGLKHQLKHSSTMNRAVENFQKKQCQMLQLLRKKKNKSDKLHLRSIHCSYFAPIFTFFIVKSKFLRKSSNFFLLIVTLTWCMVLAYEKITNFLVPQIAKIIKSKDIAKDPILSSAAKFFFFFSNPDFLVISY